MSIAVCCIPIPNSTQISMLFRCTNPEGWRLVTWYYDLSPCVTQTAIFVLPSIVAFTLGSHTLYHFSKYSKRDRPYRWQYSITWDYYTKQVSTLMTTATDDRFLVPPTNTVINSPTTSHCIDHSIDLTLCIWGYSKLGATGPSSRHIHHLSHPKIRIGTWETRIDLSATVLAV